MSFDRPVLRFERIALAVLFAATCGTASPVAKPATRLAPQRPLGVEVTGTGEVLEARGDSLDVANVGKPRPLRGRHVAVRFWSKVRPAPGSRLVVHTSLRDSFVVSERDWYPLLPPTSPSPDALQFMRAVGRVLERGGRQRVNPDGVTCWPQPGVPICPSLASVRWLTDDGTGPVSLRISAAGEVGVTWTASAPLAAGRYDGEDLRAFLAQARDKGTVLSLVVVTGGSGDPLAIRLRVMNPADERTLRQQLATDDRAPEPTRHMLRAATLLDAGLMAEAADEYEAASRVAPDRPEFLRRAVEAHRQYGNATRADSLEALLKRVDAAN